MLTDSKTTEYLLQQWSKWGKDSPKLGYPSSTPYLIRAFAHGDMPDITDEEAEQVDKAVCELSKTNPVFAEAVKLYYKTMSQRKACKMMENPVPRRTFEIYLKSGINWIDGRLSSLRETQD